MESRGRYLEKIGRFCLERRRPVLWFWGTFTTVMIVVSLLLGLDIDTSRQGMVSESNPDSARYQDYLRDFGTPLHLAVLLEGDDPARNREAADRIATALRLNPDLVKGVTVKASFEAFRPYLLLFLDDTALTRLVRWCDLLTDPDKDGIPWRKDNCPWVKNQNQSDGDGDGVGNACSMDWDADGVVDESDPCPRHPDQTPPCRPADRSLTLQKIFGGATSLLDWMEEGDLAELGPFEPLLRDIKGSAGEDNPIESSKVFSELERLFLVDEWSALSLMQGGEEEDDKLAQTGMDEFGYLSAEEGRLVFLFVQPASDGDAADDVIPFVNFVEGVLAEESGAGVTAYATGNPAFVAEEMALLSRDVLLTAIVAGIGVLLLFLFVYRSLVCTLAVFIPLLSGIAGCLGITALTYGNLNLISSSMFAIIVGLGIDFGIHLFARFREELSHASTREDAALAMLSKTGPGVMTGGITTLCAFLCLLVSDFHGMRQLGVLSAVGLLFILVSNLTLLPCLLVEFRSIQGKAPQQPGDASGGNWFGRMLRIPTRRPGMTLILMLGITVGLSLQINRFDFSFDVKEFLPQGTPARAAYDRLIATDAFTPDFAVMRSSSLEKTEAMTEALLERPDLVARVQSVVTYLPSIDSQRSKQLVALRSAYNALLERWPGLQSWKPAVDKRSAHSALLEEFEAIGDGLEMNLPFFIAQNKSRLKAEGLENVDSAHIYRQWMEFDTKVRTAPVAAQTTRFENVEERLLSTLLALQGFLGSDLMTMPVTDLPSDLLRTLHRSSDNGTEVFALQIFPTGDITDPEFMDAFLEHTRKIDPDVTGLPVTFLAFGELLTDGLYNAVIVALMIITLLLLLDYRQFSSVLLTLFPLLLGTVWMAGGMHLVGIDFNFANMMGLPLILGIGVDSGVHLVHRYRQGTLPEELVQTTGKAVGLSSFTTMVGMGSMVIATHGGVHSLGLVLLIGVLACLCTSVIVLPAWLEWLRRRAM